jgi:hypothetical protein
VHLNRQDSLPAISVLRAVIPQIMVRVVLHFLDTFADNGCFNIRLPLQNIAPTMIIVRVGSGRSVCDETGAQLLIDTYLFIMAN